MARYLAMTCLGLVAGMMISCKPPAPQLPGPWQSPSQPVLPPPVAATGSANRPVLQPLARQDYENELASGAGCTLRKRGRDLIVAVVGDAVAKVDGRVVHLSGGGSNFNNLVQGGRYSDGGLFIDLGLMMRPIPGVTSSTRAEVRIERGEEWSRFEAEWICGS
jgi:hypothetical protein